MAVYRGQTPRRTAMPFHKPLALLFASALAACAMTQADDANSGSTKASGPDGLMAWPDLLERPRPQPNSTVRYGNDPLQVVDVWQPEGPGPYPTVLMIHGGCWQTEIADRTIMNWIADDLRRRGMAVWNIDYRGVDRPGGGYPGTLLDVTKAADALRDHAAAYRLDISRIVTVGHSAGGHLALWLAARKNLTPTTIFNPGNPLPIAAAVSLGGLQDLELAEQPPGSGCGTEVIGQLIGRRISARLHPLNDTSVPRMGPLGIPQALINGNQDRIIPGFYAEEYRRKMAEQGDTVAVRMLDRTGHVELIAPETAAWAAAVEEIEKALGR
jgi:acetyl esterase/lipase